MNLQNKTIVITGASSGIGAAAAVLFAENGANVVLGARRAKDLKMLADRINENTGKATFLAGNVKDEDYALALVDQAVSKFGRLDGAFNNAGTVGEMSQVPEMSKSIWEDILSTNLTSAFFAAKAQIPALKSRGGSIVFTSSFVGYSNGGMPGMGAYAASKAGLIGLTQSLAIDNAIDRIRVNSLLPGGTKTAMAGDDPQTHEFIANLHPMKRMAEPEEIANAALFLLSDSSEFITGSAMAVDGGMSARLL